MPDTKIGFTTHGQGQMKVWPCFFALNTHAKWVFLRITNDMISSQSLIFFNKDDALGSKIKHGNVGCSRMPYTALVLISWRNRPKDRIKAQIGLNLANHLEYRAGCRARPESGFEPKLEPGLGLSPVIKSGLGLSPRSQIEKSIGYSNVFIVGIVPRRIKTKTGGREMKTLLYGVLVVAMMAIVIYLLMEGMEAEYIWRVLRYGR